MSLRSRSNVRAGETSIIGKSARLALYAGLATGLAGAACLGTSALAVAAPLGPGSPPGNGGPFAPWWGGGHFHHGYGTSGVVASVPGSSAPTTFTITTGDPATTVTVDVSATTTFREPGQSSPGLGDILMGDQVVIMGTEAGTNTIDATSVEVPPARDSGTVASTTPALTITTTNPAATITVNLSSNTTYTEPGFSPAALTDLRVGDRVLVSGTQDGTNMVNATSVYLPPAVEPGTVASTSPFTITAGDPTTVTINLSAGTTYREPGFSSPSLTNIVTGDRVVVFGTQDGTNTVNATSVDLPRAMEFGTVATAPASATATSFTITTAGRTSATVTVNVSGTTTYRDPGVSSPGLVDIVANGHVLVIGTQGGASTVNATSLLVLPAGLGRGLPGGHGGPAF